MNHSNKNFIKFSRTCGLILLGTFLDSKLPLKAEDLVCPSTTPSASDFQNKTCYITPSTYKIKVFEMGLCTSDPLAGTFINNSDEVVTDHAIDESSCQKTFESASGSVVNLAGGASSNLTGTNFRPTSGTFPSAYIKIENIFGLKGSYQVGSNTYYSTGSTPSTSSGDYVEWNENLRDFSSGPSCNGTQSQREMAGSEVFTSGITGTMKAVLANSSYLGTTKANCSNTNPTRLYGVFAPTTPVIITDETQGLEVTFTITDRGMTVRSNGSGVITSFSSGPFSPAFVTF